ncbi:MAG: TRAP transporter large permease subunit [Thermodesulfobacteriota bacterium]
MLPWALSGPFYRKLTLEKLINSTRETVQTSSMVLFLGMAANVYGAVFSRLGSGTMLVKGFLGLEVAPVIALIVLMSFVFLLGWPLEWPAIIYIFLPMMLPIVDAFGFDKLWFCILVAMNLQTALLSPPVAIAAYYLKGVAPTLSLWDIYVGMFQFMGLQVAGLAIVAFFPDTALWLPKVLFG